jgi:hypothetical protein
VAITIVNARLPVAADVSASLSRNTVNGTLSASLLTGTCGGARVGSGDARMLPSSTGQDFTWDDVGELGPFDSACQAQSVIPGGRCVRTGLGCTRMLEH